MNKIYSTNSEALAHKMCIELRNCGYSAYTEYSTDKLSVIISNAPQKWFDNYFINFK